jgi:hypothetical protein
MDAGELKHKSSRQENPNDMAKGNRNESIVAPPENEGGSHQIPSNLRSLHYICPR